MASTLSSFGTQLKLGDGGGTETFTTIPGLLDIQGGGIANRSEEATNHSSSSAGEEFIYTTQGHENITVTIQWDPSDTVHQSLQTDADNQTLRNFQLVVRPGEAEEVTEQFAALLMNLTWGLPVKGKVTKDLELQLSGTITNP